MAAEATTESKQATYSMFGRLHQNAKGITARAHNIHTAGRRIRR